MLNIFSILIALFVLGILVFIHELGHYGAGRILGFDVYEFGMGFGPVIWSKQKGITKYSIRAIPFGGFVAFDNEENLEKGELSFNKKPIWKRIIAILAGPIMNILLAYIVALVMLTLVGVPGNAPIVGEITINSPAAEAGLVKDDEFIIVNDIQINGDYEILYDVLSNNKDNELNLVLDRNGEIIKKTLTPKYDEGQDRYLMGITIGYKTQTYGFGESIGYSFNYTMGMISQLLKFLKNLIFSGEGAGDVSGPVGAVAIMSDIAKSLDLSYYLQMVAFISINLGIFNLLPVPPCDGSKVLIYLVEGVRRKPLNIKIETAIQLTGVAIFIVLFLILTYRDIIRLFTGGI